MQKLKNNEARPKFTGSYKKERVNLSWMPCKLFAKLSAFLGCFASVRPVYRSNQSGLKWNTRALRTGSGHSGSVYGSLPFSSPVPVAKEQDFRELRRAKFPRAPWTVPFELVKTNFFRPLGPRKWKATLVITNTRKLQLLRNVCFINKVNPMASITHCSISAPILKRL